MLETQPWSRLVPADTPAAKAGRRGQKRQDATGKCVRWAFMSVRGTPWEAFAPGGSSLVSRIAADVPRKGGDGEAPSRSQGYAVGWCLGEEEEVP